MLHSINFRVSEVQILAVVIYLVVYFLLSTDSDTPLDTSVNDVALKREELVVH